jgi:HEAT repeat protein
MPALSRLLVSLALAACTACAGASRDARRAQSLLARGDFAGATAAADDGLARAPRDGNLWRVKMRAALGGGDARGAVALYRDWRDLSGAEDPAALRVLARTTLWQGLTAGAPAVQVSAVRAVERLEVEELAPDVAELVTADDDLVAAAAGSALLTVHAAAPRVLVDLLKSEDKTARALAVDGIGRKAGRHARADLLPMLDDPAPEVRRAAVGAVARFAGDQELTRIAGMAGGDKDGAVRARALAVLVQKSPRGRAELARAGLRDPHPGVRHIAVQLLARDGSPAAAQILAELVAGDDLELALPAAAARFASGRAGEADLALFHRALAETRWTVRAAALNQSGAAPRELALSMAGRALVDPRPEVRLAAARVLIRTGTASDRVRQELDSHLGSPDPAIRIDAAVDLLRIGEERGAEVLAELAAHKTADVRGAAVRAHASARRITFGLVTALADTDPLLRITAAELLLELAHES